MRDLFPAGAKDVLPSVRRIYPPQLPDFPHMALGLMKNNMAQFEVQGSNITKRLLRLQADRDGCDIVIMILIAAYDSKSDCFFTLKFAP